MALLPDVDDIPFLNPYYDTLTEALGSEYDDEDEYDEYGGGSGDGMVGVIAGEGGSGDYLDYNSIISAGQEQIFAGEGGMIPVSSSNISATGRGGVRRPVKEADPMDGWFPGQEAAQRNREEFDRLGCRDHFFMAKPGRTGPMPKECERLLYSISFLTFQARILASDWSQLIT